MWAVRLIILYWGYKSHCQPHLGQEHFHISNNVCYYDEAADGLERVRGKRQRGVWMKYYRVSLVESVIWYYTTAS